MRRVGALLGSVVAAAPSGPHRGLDTSDAIVRRTSPRTGAPDRSTRASRSSEPAARGRSAPFRVQEATPSAVSSPVPPSVVAEPPRPSTTSVQPRPIAAARTWPVPRVVAAVASRSSRATRDSPDAVASSTTPRHRGAGTARRSVASADRARPPAVSHSPPPPPQRPACPRRHPRAGPAGSHRPAARATSRPPAPAPPRRSQRPLERIGRDQDAHLALGGQSPSRRCSRYSGMRTMGGRSASARSMTSSASVVRRIAAASWSTRAPRTGAPCAAPPAAS